MYPHGVGTSVAVAFCPLKSANKFIWNVLRAKFQCAADNNCRTVGQKMRSAARAASDPSSRLPIAEIWHSSRARLTISTGCVAGTLLSSLLLLRRRLLPKLRLELLRHCLDHQLHKISIPIIRVYNRGNIIED